MKSEKRDHNILSLLKGLQYFYQKLSCQIKKKKRGWRENDANNARNVLFDQRQQIIESAMKLSANYFHISTFYLFMNEFGEKFNEQ